jgi:hypothetical protein
MHPPAHLFASLYLHPSRTQQVPRPVSAYDGENECTGGQLLPVIPALRSIHSLSVLLFDHLIVLYCNSPTRSRRPLVRSFIRPRPPLCQYRMHCLLLSFGNGGWVGSAAKLAVRRTARPSVLGSAAFPFPVSNIKHLLLYA